MTVVIEIADCDGEQIFPISFVEQIVELDLPINYLGPDIYVGQKAGKKKQKPDEAGGSIRAQLKRKSIFSRFT